MDATPPTRFARADLSRLALLALVSVGIHGWLIARSEVAARDSIGFVRQALQLETPPAGMSRLDVIRDSQHPPGYAVAVLGMSYLVRPFAGVDCDSMVLSAQLVAALAALLTVLPMYLLGRALFGRDVGFVAAAMHQGLPVYARISSDGLADSLFLLFAVTALWLGVRAMRDRRVRDFALCGLASGTAYLVRPEGLLVGGVVGVTLIGLWGRSAVRFRPALANGVALAAGAALATTPYMALIGGLTNKPTGTEFLNTLQGEPSNATWQGAPAEARTGGMLLIAAWWHEPSDGGSSRALWALRQLADETLKSAHYLPGVLALVGVGVFARRWRREAALALPVLVALAHLVLLWVLATRIGYVSERHTQLAVACGCLFAAAAVSPVGRWMASRALWRRGDVRLWTVVLLVAVFASQVPAVAKTRLHVNRVGHRHAGEWLAAHAEADAVIYDPFCWAQFYAGRAWVIEPFPTSGSYPGDVILEPNSSTPHSRLPMLEIAKGMANSGSPVYHWPPDGPAAKAKVVVFKAVPPGDGEGSAP